MGDDMNVNSSSNTQQSSTTNNSSSTNAKTESSLTDQFNQLLSYFQQSAPDKPGGSFPYKDSMGAGTQNADDPSDTTNQITQANQADVNAKTTDVNSLIGLSQADIAGMYTDAPTSSGSVTKSESFELVVVPGGGEDGEGGETNAASLTDPKLSGADPLKAASYIMKATGSTPAGQKHTYNLFLSNLAGVAMLEAMMAEMKSQQVLEKVSSNMDVATKNLILGQSKAIAQNITQAGQAEAMSDFIQAAVSIANVAISFVGMYKTAGAGDNPGEVQMIKMGTDAFQSLTQGISQASTGIIKLETTQLQASKEVMDTIKQLLLQWEQKVADMGKTASDTFNSFQQALNQWMDSLSQAVNKIGV